MENKNDILDKISALLERTTAKGATEAEAEAALLLAQRIMAKYHIELSEVVRPDQGPTIGRSSTERKAMSQWAIRLLNLVADNFRCKTYLQNHCGAFIGEDVDLKLATEMYRMLYDFMDQGATRIRRQYRKQGLPTDGVGDSYLLGFLRGLKEALDEQKRTENSSFALILVTPQAVVKAYEDLSKNWGKPVHGRSLNGGDDDAFRQGMREGKNSLHKRLA